MSASSTKSSKAEVAKKTTPQGSGENGNVPHLSLRERAAHGKAGGGAAPRARRVVTVAGSSRSSGASREAGRVPSVGS